MPVRRSPLPSKAFHLVSDCEFLKSCDTVVTPGADAGGRGLSVPAVTWREGTRSSHPALRPELLWAGAGQGRPKSMRRMESLNAPIRVEIHHGDVYAVGEPDIQL